MKVNESDVQRNLASVSQQGIESEMEITTEPEAQMDVELLAQGGVQSEARARTDPAAQNTEPDQNLVIDEQPPKETSIIKVRAMRPNQVSHLDKIMKENLELKEKLLKMDKKVLDLQMEKDAIKEKLNDIFGFQYVKEKGVINFYTGIPSIPLFMWVVKRVERMGGRIICKKLSFEDHVLLVLMKLKLGSFNQDIADKFGISRRKVSTLFRRLLPIIAKSLKKLIIWPERHIIRSNMPSSFKRHYSDCVCIIDCTEIFTDRPKDLTARAQVFSSYKNHCTLKYLVGISPSGGVMFLSSGWGGRVSDKEITLKSDFLSHISYGDLVLADRGFLIEEELNMVGAHLKIPAFTRGKSQLGAGDVDTSRQLSNVRIHVERVIGAMKKFRILQMAVPLTLIDCFDNIMVIIAGLTNLNKSIVKD